MAWQLLELLCGHFSEEAKPEDIQKATATCKADRDIVIAKVLKNLPKRQQVSNFVQNFLLIT